MSKASGTTGLLPGKLGTDIVRAARKMFPVQRHGRHDDCPLEVPWNFISPHAAQAHNNHDQTLERLAERGGLDASEMVAIIDNRPWHPMSDERAVARLKELLALHDVPDLRRE